MFLAYLDESGNTGARPDPDQPIHLIGCLLVEDSQVRPLEDALAEVVNRRFPLLCRRPGFELHAADLYGGSGWAKGVAPQVRIDTIGEIVDAVSRHSDSFSYFGVDKLRSFANAHPHRIAFQFLVENLEPYLQRKGALGLLVADENHEVSQNLIDDFAIFKEFATTWGYKSVKVQSIIDSVHFVQSHNNRIIQAVDMLTYFTLKGYRIGRRKIETFLALPQPRESYPVWLAANLSRSEQTVLEIKNKIALIPGIGSKIWP
ncbi:MAG: DUF3800 domain-containing protein [Brevundimonas sp.]|uniref:DUF3800 domain-containing protein n=1 Tax=Brevundimonas sp. TaxID=1871086 RepID=UPI0024886B9C|nr:DUF3800 domain-containing protein [Brevundimonas sp.]MDI1327999.1 DUF3800 domain-containing protein [Brevundimonas sp.]